MRAVCKGVGGAVKASGPQICIIERFREHRGGSGNGAVILLASLAAVTNYPKLGGLKPTSIPSEPWRS